MGRELQRTGAQRFHTFPDVPEVSDSRAAAAAAWAGVSEADILQPVPHVRLLTLSLVQGGFLSRSELTAS